MQMDVFAKMYLELDKGSNRTSPQRPRQTPFPRPLENALRKRLQTLSQERLFITYDDSFKRLAVKKPGQSPSPDPSPLRKSLRRRLSDSTEFSLSDGSYADMHCKKESQRRVREWADIRTAEAVAAGKYRVKSPGVRRDKRAHIRSASTEEVIDSHRSLC